MKLSRLFLLAVMGLGLIACTENDLVEGGDSNGAQNEDTTYVGFTIDFSKTQTRATTETGTAAEQKINKAYVILAASGNISQIAETPKGTSNNKYVLQTTPGPHDFYVVVNPTTEPTVGTSIDAYFNTGVAIGVDEFANTTPNSESFLMASVKKETFDIADGVTEEEALAGTDATANNFTINVERVAAKVTMTCNNLTLSSGNNNAAGGEISKTTFNLMGGATMAYRMAQSTIVEIPNNAWTYTVKNVAVATTGDHTGATPAYCLENIHAANSYKQKNTTYLTLQTTFKPTNVVDCADDVKPLKTNTLAAGAPFYVVQTGSLAGNYLMKTDLENYQKLAGNTGKLPAGVESISAEYEEGVCWFGPIWINETEETSDQSTTVTTSPVVRNTWYNLKITGITLPGEPSEPQIDPEQPLTPPTDVAITLTVQPWNFIDCPIELQ